MKKKILFTILLCFSITLSNAQQFWKKHSAKSVVAKEQLLFRKNTPTKYEVFTLDLEGFKAHLNLKSRGDEKYIYLPSPSGKLKKFSVKEAPTLDATLSKKYANIKSYTARGIDDKTAYAKLSYGTDGVHVAIFSDTHSTLYIDPLTKNRKKYIAYERNNLPLTDTYFNCSVKSPSSEDHKSHVHQKQETFGDGKARTYRLALVATAEYSLFHLNSQGVDVNDPIEKRKEAIIAAMNTTITRVNGVYERELAVKLVIVAGTEKVIYFNASTDGLSNSDGNSLINESQVKCDSEIGSANFDIGHTFSTGGGGLAGLGVVCDHTRKAEGVTGSPSPIGDPYDIDYVAHEMGHQFGANHTFNNACSNNRNNSTALEPGSGSTIMAYAGICPPNVKARSDDYFHSVSIKEIWSVINSRATCATTQDISNIPPVVNAGSDYVIPSSTPFVLRGQATDTETNLTYGWEQNNNELSTQPPVATNTNGPSFRSIPPSASPNRYLPSLASLAGLESGQWEVVSSVAREYDFVLSVRDNFVDGGAIGMDEMKVKVVETNPFIVTSQSTDNISIKADVKEMITWDVGATDKAPINSEKVNIRLSLDGGLTYPHVLAENTANDGSEEITIPNLPTTTARIMVESADNIFFNINSFNFTIISSTPTFVLTNKTTDFKSVCNNSVDENTKISYTINFEFLNGFSETATLSATNTPSGATVAFDRSTINQNGDVIMTISDFTSSDPKDYTITVTGTSNTVTASTEVALQVLSGSFDAVTLTAPENAALDQPIIPRLEWDAVSNASSYDVLLATDANFNNIVLSTNVDTNNYQVTDPLDGETIYYWSVTPKNKCGIGSRSATFSFLTIAPSYCTSTFTKSNNSEWISNVTFNTIDNDSGNDHDNGKDDGYEDFTSISTTVKQGETHEISVSFDTKAFQDHCYVFIDWNQDFIFDTTNERYDLGSKSSKNSTDPVTATFDITVPNNAKIGSTRMRVLIEYDDPKNNYGEGACDTDHKTGWGETEDYSITVQDKSLSDGNNFNFNNFSLYPNPSNGEFNLSFKAEFGANVYVKLVDFKGQVINKQKFDVNDIVFSTVLDYNNVSSGIYLLQISNGVKHSTKRVVIE